MSVKLHFNYRQQVLVSRFWKVNLISFSCKNGWKFPATSARAAAKNTTFGKENWNIESFCMLSMEKTRDPTPTLGFSVCAGRSGRFLLRRLSGGAEVHLLRGLPSRFGLWVLQRDSLTGRQPLPRLPATVPTLLLSVFLSFCLKFLGFSFQL